MPDGTCVSKDALPEHARHRTEQGGLTCGQLACTSRAEPETGRLAQDIYGAMPLRRRGGRKDWVKQQARRVV